MTDPRALFLDLYTAATEDALYDVIGRYAALADSDNWRPYGGNENNYAIVENQQASPIPALVEKVTNSIDAILMRRCLEAEIDPKSPEAPRSIDEAVERFFPGRRDWDLAGAQRKQAASIQIIADGPKGDTSAIVYDDGEGQHPDDFETTFLSLVRGNKNEIPFVQGKYNMGGTGALVFCGKRRYQLIGSRSFRGGPFGFTLVRRHPMTDEERETKKNTWYEYLTLGGRIPRFEVSDGLFDDGIDFGLHGRRFETGTVIKLYSYAFPSGHATFSRDLRRSVNEYLFEPALPILMVESEERYPNDRNLARPLYGLKRELERRGKYVEDSFSETMDSGDVGSFKVTCYVFEGRVDGKSARETRTTIRTEFFKNGMTVVFSLNGQVHGHYSTEFVTRTLRYHILKDHLLIHVDCTDLRFEFRNELFMASRDRLKSGAEAARLRSLVADALKGGKLKAIYKRRKQAIAVASEDAEDLLRSVAKNLPLNRDLVRLLDQSFRLQRKDEGQSPSGRSRPKPQADADEEFVGKRFPTFLDVVLKGADEEGTPLVRVPAGGTRHVTLRTDVEDQYLDRVDEPGDLRVELLDFTRSSGGGGEGLPTAVSEVFDVQKSSPDQGTIRVRLGPEEGAEVGDTSQVRVTLTGPGRDFHGVFLARVTERRKASTPKPKEPDPTLGLPKLITVEEIPTAGGASWDDLEGQGVEFGRQTIMHPMIDEEDSLSAIYVNLNSKVLMSYKSGLSSSEQMDVAERRYISSVYFHTLFLYALNRSRAFEIYRREGDREPEAQDLGSYLKEMFEGAYAEFLLNFETSELLNALE